MNSFPSTSQNPSPASSTSFGSQPRAGALTAIPDAGAAANDDTAAMTSDDTRNPLWIIVCAMVLFFATMALLIASG